MTREEAIAVLNMVEAHGSLVVEAKDMAIKALEQEPSEDCVSRKSLLEWVKESLEQYANTYSNDMLNMWMLFEEQIKALPPVAPTQRWIPVSEKLPQKSGLYLVNIGDLVTTMSFDGHHFRRDCMTYDVVAWMSLPEPYKAEMESEE